MRTRRSEANRARSERARSRTSDEARAAFTRSHNPVPGLRDTCRCRTRRPTVHSRPSETGEREEGGSVVAVRVGLLLALLPVEPRALVVAEAVGAQIDESVLRAESTPE